MSDLQKLMQETYLAQQKFRDEWKKWRSGKIKRTKSKKEKRKLREIEPQTVTDARKVYLQRLEKMYETQIIPLEIVFRENPHSVFDEMLEFLATDILVFRTGYAKEEFINLLKKVELNEIQIKKVQAVALQICERESIRREFRYWCRLMNKIADKEFVLQLQNLLKNQNEKVRLKAKWALKMIYENNPELRKHIQI